LREFVAEASAHAALLAMEVDTSGYRLDYIKWWTREPGMVLGEHPDNPSTSVTNMAELLAAGLIQQHFPQRFDHEPPAILLEHYPRELHSSGRTARQPTWDWLSFHSWAPRRVWLGGRERQAFGEPEWRSVPEHEGEALVNREEMGAQPPSSAID
jgi:hypothetical protein